MAKKLPNAGQKRPIIFLLNWLEDNPIFQERRLRLKSTAVPILFYIQMCTNIGGLYHHDYYQQPTFGIIYLAEINCCLPLFDPQLLLQKLKRSVEIYPAVLGKR